MSAAYDSFVLVSFGGPEGPDDVLPFMENVTRGRGIPRERLVEVSKHYDLFGGVSPINGINRALLDALRPGLAARGLAPYWGNRNWHPYLGDTATDMRADGRGRAIAFATSAYSSFSGCRQYRNDIAGAFADGEPHVDKIRVFFDHPGFIDPMADAAIASIRALEEGGTVVSHVAHCAHSIPMSMADGCDYVVQLEAARALVDERIAAAVGARPSALVFQSRSGAPGQPWLEPDISDHLTALKQQGATGVVMVPLGFVSDHMEVIYDLDTQATATANELGLRVARSATPGTDVRFVEMVLELVDERIDTLAGRQPNRRALSNLAERPDPCAVGCCAAPARPSAPPR